MNHVFQPGHRIMVQVQSSLFPLYDRNPQTFVPNIFFAKPQRLSRGDGDDRTRRGDGELGDAADRPLRLDSCIASAIQPAACSLGDYRCVVSF